MILTLMAAYSRTRALGADNRMLWHLPEDFRFFKEQTTGHTLLMGRKTYESIGRALPNRRTIVITRDESWSAPDAEVAHSVDAALALADAAEDEVVFSAGGGEIYAQTLPLADVMLLTHVDSDVDGDAHFPVWDPADWRETWREHRDAQGDRPAFDWVRYERVR